MSTPPLKRHPALQPLSREHFNGLVQARRLVHAAEAGAAAQAEAVGAFARAWREEIAPHFEDEERLLMPLVAPEQAERLRREHARLRDLAGRVLEGRGGEQGERLRELGRLLHDHIRWEERSLFVQVQEGATAAELERIAAATRRVEAQRPGSRRRGDPGPEAATAG